MKYRKLGRIDYETSEVGIGTWQLGGTEWGDVTEEDALNILRKAVELGVNFIDTADIYGGGRSETIIGKFLKEVKGKIFVATKLGRKSEPGWPENFTLETIRKHTQDSLKRLGVEAIDLQQFHCIPTEVMKDGEVFDHMNTIKKEGLIKNWGASVESTEEAMICMQCKDCMSLQVIFNIFRQRIANEVLPVAKDLKVAILARVPLASGLLSGKFKQGHKFDSKDHRCYNADGQCFNVGETFAGIPFEKGVGFAEKIKGILKPNEKATMAELSLRWILDHDAVSTAIPGATKINQAESNAKTSGLPSLGKDAHEKLKELYKNEIRHTIRGKY